MTIQEKLNNFGVMLDDYLTDITNKMNNDDESKPYNSGKLAGSYTTLLNITDHYHELLKSIKNY
jgi:hypothetical protein